MSRRHRLAAVLAAAAALPAAAPGSRAQDAPIPSTTSAASTGPGNPSFNLLNRSGRPIREIYASPASRRAWGSDLLAPATLPSGRSVALRLPVGECVYDLRVVYDDGAAEERRGLNTCDLTTVPFP